MLGRYWVLWSKGFCSILLRSFRSPWSSIQIDVAFCVTCRNFVLFEVPVDVYSYSLSMVLWSADEPWKQLARILSWMDNRITNAICQRHSSFAGNDHLQHRWTCSVFQSCLAWQRVLWWWDSILTNPNECLAVCTSFVVCPFLLPSLLVIAGTKSFAS